jgi:hypothetical protein
VHDRGGRQPAEVGEQEHADAGLAEQGEQGVEADAAGLDVVVPADGDVAVVGAVPRVEALAGRDRAEAVEPPLDEQQGDAPGRQHQRSPGDPAGERRPHVGAPPGGGQPNTTRAKCSK